MKSQFALFFSMFFGLMSNAQNIKLVLKFIDKNTSTNIDNVDVYSDSLHLGTANYYGYFAVQLSKGNYNFLFSHSAYNDYILSVSLEKDSVIKINLNDNQTLFRPVIKISVNKNDFGKRILSAYTIKKMPALLSESDPSKVVQLVAGVSNVQEFNSGIYVRGGNLDQSMILYDEAPIYNSQHYMGFFSTFDINAIQSISLYKNSLPAKFGGRGSSIVEVKSRDGDFNNHHQFFELGVTQAKVLFEGPLKKKKSSYLLSSRLGYPLLLFSPKLGAGLKNYTNFFYDINAKIAHQINSKNNVFYSFFASNDKFTPNGDVNLGGLDYTSSVKSQTATLRWNCLVNKSIFMNTSLSYSNYKNGLLADESDVRQTNYNSIRNYLIKSDLEKTISKSIKVRFGFQTLMYMGQTRNLYTYFNVPDSSLTVNRGVENSIYYSTDYKYKQHKIIAGGRVSTYFAILPEKISFVNLEPRITYQYLFKNNRIVSFSYDKSMQYQHLISQNLVLFPSDFWANSTEFLKPQKTHSYSLGYQMNPFKWQVISSIYYKNYNNSFDYKDGADVSVIADLESQLSIVQSYAYGYELEIQKVLFNKINFNLNYTFSRSFKRSDEINKGQWYPSNFDRPHQLNFGANWQVNKRLSLNLLFVLQSGRAMTIRELPFLFSDKNAFRLPIYHRLDIGGKYCRNPEKKNFKSVWGFSIYNVYNNKNVYNIYWEHKSQNFVSYTLLPIIPSVSYSLQIK